MRFLWVALIAITPFFSGCYVLSQAFYQNSLMNTRLSVEKVIADKNTDQKVKKKLQKTRSILAFASKNGLNVEQSYNYYIPMQGPYVSHIVSAAHKDRLKSVTFWFPIVGSVPYIGFFHEKDRDAKAKELQEEGYDITKGGVSAFSSLGWFSDPIYKSMLRRSDARLAHLFFHELTHRTYWSIGSVKFNENLAEYVAMYLTRAYLAEIGAKKQLLRYDRKLVDKKKYKKWLKKLRSRLKENYQKDIPLKDKLTQKSLIFKEFLTTYFPAFTTRYYKSLAKREWNNAVVLASSLYSPDTERFQKAHTCLKKRHEMAPVTIGQFLEALSEAEEEHDDAFAALDHLCLIKGSNND